MATKFGFQVTVQDRTIWIFPEDVDGAAVAAKAEAEMTKFLLKKIKAETPETIKALVGALPDEVKTSQISELAKATSPSDEDIDKMAQFLLKNASIDTIKTGLEKAKEDAKNEIDKLKTKANAGIAYSWIRGAGEDPIQLGTLSNLVTFINDSIIQSLPSVIRPNFDAEEQFNALVGGFPDPINKAVDEFATKAIFELDGLRLKIPGKGSTEKMQFEVVMLIDLIALELDLGPFQVNRLYAKLGNFEPPVPALAEA